MARITKILTGILSVTAMAVLVAASLTMALWAQSSDSMDKVMTLAGDDRQFEGDRGAAGLWQRLLKLNTTASALHTTAHPDDENGGVLTYLSRARGARMALLTLNRGESGANAIGAELFDGLGLIRTEELLLSDRYYGLDDQYFSTVIDYGYSKSLEEALEKWGRENVLRDVVRVIRINRPLVVISRFYGGDRDGHGNHQTAGVISQEAYKAAADPDKFPEQIREGLRPWQPLKLYRGIGRINSTWNIRINAGQYSPWLGKSYRQFASDGLALQRSQTSGRLREVVGEYPMFYERLYSEVDAADRETDFFAGIDTSITGIFSITGGTPPARVPGLLADIQANVEAAMEAFSVANPSATVPFLAKGLETVRETIGLVGEFPDAVFMLRIKEKQFQEAIHTALGMGLSALAIPEQAQMDNSPWASTPTMGLVVPGQSFKVITTLSNGSSLSVEPMEVTLKAPQGWTVNSTSSMQMPSMLQADRGLRRDFGVQVASDAGYDNRYFHRGSIQESRYQLRSPEDIHLPARPPALTAHARYSVYGVPLEIDSVVHTEESNLPYGFVKRQLMVAPRLAVNVEPEMRVVPLAKRNAAIEVDVELINNAEGASQGTLTLEAPQGWRVRPQSQDFSFSQAGERQSLTFSVQIPRVEAQDYEIKAVATVDGQQYTQGYQTIRHRDLETRYIYRDAVATVRGVDVEMAPGLEVGYVMGVGDEVPSGISQLGASVTLLDRSALATDNLSRFDAIVVGTRAYAVREDLITYNQRLLDYAHDGGNLIILYNTQEFKPERWAAYPAVLPRRAEEVSEEDSPVKILAPDHVVFQKPNKITLADFDNWVEQRGSKFFSEWDDSYTAMIETQDRGQDPQRGGWVTAKYGQGYYTYFAYAFHRQSPYGVPGAYRIFANLLSLGN
ncbi:MAG TPA: PIG-L family deacetylase [Acidobacteriota bacterium]|nr:PIG-L family deacetylase [Acidobacteriota bacterium]